MSPSAASSRERPARGAALRAGIVVTGTEVLTGRVRDRNGPWLAERLHELGIDLAHVLIVGDRPADLRAALAFMAGQGLELVLTSGGLGPTADDLTAEIVGAFQGREMVLDEALEERIAQILRRLAGRFRNLDIEAVRAGNRKQATIPRGATVLEPVGTAPGLIVTPASSEEGAGGGHEPGTEAAPGPTVVVLPGPPRELQPMWEQARHMPAFQAAIAGAPTFRIGTMRLFGMPESEIAQTLRVAQQEGVQLERLEVTTCLKRAEVEVVTRYEPDAEDVYEALASLVRRRHADTLFSTDGSTVDEQVAALLAAGPDGRSRTIATAESCTGGLLAARLTERAGASAYFNGGIVAYSNAAKVSLAGVAEQLIDEHGAVSAQVARALADGARERLQADVGVGITGVAGPGGGSEEKSVGLVWVSATLSGGAGVAEAGATDAPVRELTRSVQLPGGRADVRDRATSIAMHLVRRLLSGEE